MVSLWMEKQRWLGHVSHEDGRDDKTRQLIRCWVEGVARKRGESRALGHAQGTALHSTLILIGCLLCAGCLSRFWNRDKQDTALLEGACCLVGFMYEARLEEQRPERKVGRGE